MAKQGESGISWTDRTWNPLRGCSRVSPGCQNCYAERIAARFSGPGQPYEGLAEQVNGHPRWTGTIRTVPEHLYDPLRWRTPSRVFVNSMSDLFHESVSRDFIREVFAVMRLTPQHTYQVLTKRPGAMYNFMHTYFPEPLPNVWLGTSVEDQRRANERISWLMETPAAVRFLSCEPLLGPINLLTSDTLRLLQERLSWVIVGGESGPGARPMHPDWARSLRNQCQQFGIPFHFKQWGAYLPGEVRDWRDTPGASRRVHFQDGSIDGHRGRGDDYWWDDADGNVADRLVSVLVGKHAAGRLLDGRTWDEFPSLAVPV